MKIWRKDRTQYAKLYQFTNSKVLLTREDNGARLLFILGCYSNVEEFEDIKGQHQFRVVDRNTPNEKIYEWWAKYKCSRKDKKNKWYEDEFYYGTVFTDKNDWRICEVKDKRTQAEFMGMEALKPLKQCWAESKKIETYEEE